MVRQAMVRYTLAMAGLYRIRFILVMIIFISAASACGNPPRTLVIAIPPWETTLNPTITDNPNSRQIAANIYESLLKINDDGSVIPWLASSWDWDSAGTVLTLTLRQDILLHDGSLLDAGVAVTSLRQAVQSSASRDLGPFSSVPILIGATDAIEVIDHKTLSIHLSRPHVPFLRTLATPVLTPIMGKNPTVIAGEPFYPGTGQFKLTAFHRKKSSIILDSFKQYWGRAPQPQRIIFISITDSEDALQLLRDGEVDLSMVISVSDINEVISSDSMDLVAGPHVNYHVIGMNNQRPPFDNLDARRALAMGIDREKLAEDYYKGAAAPTRSYIVDGLFPAVASPQAPEYNPGLARKLVESAIHTQNRDITMLFPPIYSPGKQHWLTENLQQMLGPLGLRLLPHYTDNFDEYATLVEQMDWDISLDGMVTDNRDLFEFLYILYGYSTPDGGSGLFGINSRELSGALESASRSRDPDEQIRHFEQVLDIVAGEIPCIPLWSRAHFLIRSSEVEDFTLGMDIGTIFSNVRKKSWK